MDKEKNIEMIEEKFPQCGNTQNIIEKNQVMPI